MKIAVIGLGYVGLPLASLLATNFSVVGFDVDHKRINELRNMKIPINEPGIENYFLKAVELKKLLITDSPALIRDANVKIITVGTPYDETRETVDYSQLNSALDRVIPNLEKGDIIILKSTVPPGTTTGVVKSKIETNGLKVPDDIGLVFAPERMIEGQAIKDFQELPKIIGATDKKSLEIAINILKTLGGKTIPVSNPQTAEMIKMVDNYSRFVFIGLTNELALACEKIGVDIIEVIDSAKDDYPRNAGILQPGPGVGGSCLNKDPYILSSMLKRNGFVTEMVHAAKRVNREMPTHVVDLVYQFRSSGKVTILGVAFKGNTNDVRYTPTFIVKEGLLNRGFEVVMTDPYVNGKNIMNDVYSAVYSSDILIIMTDHEEYRKLDLVKIRNIVNSNPLIIDTRAVVNREKAEKLGFEYHGLGRI